MGNGNLYHTLFDTLPRRARTAFGGALRPRADRRHHPGCRIDDAKYGFVAAETLNPQKARVLLMLAPDPGQDPAQIQRWFQVLNLGSGLD